MSYFPFPQRRPFRETADTALALKNLPASSWGNSYVNKSGVTDAVQSMDGFKEGTSPGRFDKRRYFELVVKEEYVFIRTNSGRRPRAF